MKNLTRTGPLRIHRGYRDDLHVIADVTPARFIGAFRVTLTGLKARIGLGTVANLIPTLGGVGLDGLNSDGEPAPVPTVDLRDGPNTEKRSWVCLQVTVDKSSGDLDTETVDAQTIVHISDLTDRIKNGLALDDGQGRAIWPLAMILWSDANTPKRVIRNVYFNQQHSFIAAAAPAKSWHIFSPAA